MAMSDTSSPPSRSSAGQLELKSAPEPSTRKRKKTGQNENMPRKKAAKADAHIQATKSDTDAPEEQAGIDDAFAKMDGPLLSDYLAQKTRKFEKHLSVVELEDRHIPEKAFRDTVSWDKGRQLDNLAEYLKHFSDQRTGKRGLAWAPASKGTPHTIVITGAGLRAANLVRALRKFRTKDAAVAKLFAKHIKLKDAEHFLKSSRVGLAVGTPTRLLDLLNAGALSVERLQRIVVDSSHFDQKKRSIFDMRETFVPLMDFLNRPEFKSRYGASSDDRLDFLFF